MSARSGSSRSRGRAPAPPPRRGLLSGMSAAPMDSMPRIRTAFTRGLAGTWSSPLVVGSLLAWLLAEWLVVVALGYPGPFALLAHVSAPTPLSTFTDLSLSTGILGVRQGLLFVFGTAAVHALWFSVLIGLAIETIESGGATRWGAIRGLLSGMSATPMDTMPRIRTAFTRGLAGTWSSPVVVGSLLA